MTISSVTQVNPVLKSQGLIVKSKQDSLIKRIWDKTLGHLKTRDGLKDFMKLGYTFIDWIKLVRPKTYRCVDNLRNMFSTGNNVINAMQLPEAVIGFGDSLATAAKKPSKETVKNTVMSGLGVASPLSYAAKLLQEAKVVNLSKQALRNLSYFSNSALVIKTGHGSVSKAKEVVKQAADLSNTQNKDEKKLKAHLLFNTSLGLGVNGSFLGLGVLGLSSLLGAVIAPPIFLALGTSALVCSLLGTYHKGIVLEPQKTK